MLLLMTMTTKMMIMMTMMMINRVLKTFVTNRQATSLWCALCQMITKNTFWLMASCGSFKTLGKQLSTSSPDNGKLSLIFSFIYDTVRILFFRSSVISVLMFPSDILSLSDVNRCPFWHQPSPICPGQFIYWGLLAPSGGGGKGSENLEI